MMHIVTKAMVIQFIDGKCHKKRKSHKSTLSSYYASVSHDLLLVPLGVGTHTHTRTHTNIPMFADEMISRNQACACMPGLKSTVSQQCICTYMEFLHVILFYLR